MSKTFMISLKHHGNIFWPNYIHILYNYCIHYYRIWTEYLKNSGMCSALINIRSAVWLKCLLCYILHLFSALLRDHMLKRFWRIRKNVPWPHSHVTFRDGRVILISETFWLRVWYSIIQFPSLPALVFIFQWFRFVSV